MIVPEKPLWEGNNKVCVYVCIDERKVTKASVVKQLKNSVG